MKKTLLISTLAMSAILNLTPAEAASSKEENIGFATGAVTGAAIGGPVGLIVGGVIGILVGDQVEKANRFEHASQALSVAQQNQEKLTRELSVIQQELNLESAQQVAEQIAWMTEGLTLNVMFTTNSAGLSDNDLNNIQKIASILTQFPELTIQLDGYADPRGTQAENQKLSQARVSSVKFALEAYGILPERVVANAHGEIDGATGGAALDLDAYALQRKVSVNFNLRGENRVAQN